MRVIEITSGIFLLWPFYWEKIIPEGQPFSITASSLIPGQSSFSEYRLTAQGPVEITSTRFDYAPLTSVTTLNSLPEPRFFSIPGLRITQSWQLSED